MTGGLPRSDTYREAVPGLLFLYRLGMDKIGVPSPRGKGSCGKLQRKDNTLKASIYLPASQPQKRTPEHASSEKTGKTPQTLRHAPDKMSAVQSDAFHTH